MKTLGDFLQDWDRFFQIDLQQRRLGNPLPDNTVIAAGRLVEKVMKSVCVENSIEFSPMNFVRHCNALPDSSTIMLAERASIDAGMLHALVLCLPAYRGT